MSQSAPAVDANSERGSAWPMRGVLALAVIIAFGASINGQFVGWDDHDLIAQNPKVNPPTIAGLARLWRGPDHQMYIPVVYTAWWTLAHVPGSETGNLSAVAFHATNVVLHIMSAWAVFEILTLLVRSRFAACAGAMLFAVHPLQTEAVAWATGLKDVLSGCLALVCIWRYLLARRDAHLGRYVLATVLFALALLAKPSTVCVPAICLVLNWLKNQPPSSGIPGEGRGEGSAHFLVPIGWLALCGIAVLIAAKVQPILTTLASTKFISRPLIAADSLAWYVAKLFWPIGLAVDYSRTPAMVLSSGHAIYEAIAVAAVIIGVIICRRREYIAAMLVFVAALLPVLGLTPFVFQKYSTVADRYAYLAMLGPAIALAFVLAKFDPRKWLPPAGIVLMLLIVLSLRQTLVWRDTLSLFTHTLDINPNSLAATRSLGFYWAEHHDDAQAAAYFETANQRHPEDSTNHFNYANLFLRHGMIDQAIAHYRDAIAIDAENAQYHLNLGVALAAAGRNDEALTEFQNAAQLNPDSADAWQNAGLMLEKLGRIDDAKEAFNHAIALDPNRVIARQHLDHLR